MKIINFKLSIPKIIAIVISIIAIIFIISALVRFLDFATGEEIVMTNENYTQILKDCHQNIENYIDKKIYTTGYIYRPSDVKENEFVIARDMLINKSEAQIVGFLATYDQTLDLDDNIWIEARGIIKEGDYHGSIPIIEIKSIKRITTPEEIFVYPPN